MRRADREVKDFDEICDILDKSQILHLALCDKNKPYSVPMNFGYEVKDGKIFVYLHGAKEGKKHDILKVNDNVCFSGVSVAEIGKSEKAQNWTEFYKSVIAFGKISVIEDENEKIKGLDLMMRHYGFLQKALYPPESLKAVRVLKIAVDEITGKQHLK
jgi:nitroimidazol reductase NimA-like FMN-containing flavoprotein (pyridoxamine 5'-phosphate oxidase superfamily)